MESCLCTVYNRRSLDGKQGSHNSPLLPGIINPAIGPPLDQPLQACPLNARLFTATEVPTTQTSIVADRVVGHYPVSITESERVGSTNGLGWKLRMRSSIERLTRRDNSEGSIWKLATAVAPRSMYSILSASFAANIWGRRREMRCTSGAGQTPDEPLVPSICHFPFW
jgi:hypothetical protein